MTDENRLSEAARSPLPSTTRRIPDGGTAAGLPTFKSHDTEWFKKPWSFGWTNDSGAFAIVTADAPDTDGARKCLALTPNKTFAEYVCAMQDKFLEELELDSAASEEAPVTGKEELSRSANVGGLDDAGETARVGEGAVVSRTRDLPLA